MPLSLLHEASSQCVLSVWNSLFSGTQVTNDVILWRGFESHSCVPLLESSLWANYIPFLH